MINLTKIFTDEFDQLVFSSLDKSDVPDIDNLDERILEHIEKGAHHLRAGNESVDDLLFERIKTLCKLLYIRGIQDQKHKQNGEITIAALRLKSLLMAHDALEEV